MSNMLHVLQNGCASDSHVRTEEYAVKIFRIAHTSATVYQTLLATTVNLVSCLTTQLL